MSADFFFFPPALAHSEQIKKQYYLESKKKYNCNSWIKLLCVTSSTLVANPQHFWKKKKIQLFVPKSNIPKFQTSSPAVKAVKDGIWFYSSLGPALVNCGITGSFLLPHLQLIKGHGSLFFFFFYK